MKIAVLYIGIGSYSVMWDGFYESAKKHFFKNDEVKFYLFTDKNNLKTDDDVTIIESKNYGWPGNTLYRFRMFSSLGDELNDYDFAFFFNANAFFLKDVGNEILPEKGEKLIGVKHFRCENRNPVLIGYDRNKKSTAFVKWGNESKFYCQACFIGATGSEMLKMSKLLAKNIEIDEKNGICAKWHDESHFNKYLCDHDYKLLDFSYAYPESVKPEGHEPIILMRNKENFANLNVLRFGKKRSLLDFIKFKWTNLSFKVNSHWHLMLLKLQGKHGK